MAGTPLKNSWRTVGRVEMAAEDAFLGAMTRGIYRFRLRHPLWYGLFAFVIGAGVISIFTASTYAWWVHYPIDVVTAVYQIFFGGLFGGIAAAILAFLYARSLRHVVGQAPGFTPRRRHL